MSVRFPYYSRQAGSHPRNVRCDVCDVFGCVVRGEIGNCPDHCNHLLLQVGECGWLLSKEGRFGCDTAPSSGEEGEGGSLHAEA